MAISNTATPKTASSYELVGRRIQRTVADPKVQKTQSVIVARLDGEPLDAWERVIHELEETDGVTIDRNDDGSICISWKRFIDG